MRLIDGDALIEQLKSSSAYNDYEWSMYADGFIEDIENAPTIDVVPKDFHDKTCEAMAKRHTEEIQRLMPKRGKWKIEVAETIYGKAYLLTCSECGETVSVTETALPYEHFCRNCGASMREREGE